MNGYITAKEAGEKWGVTDRQVQLWCKAGKIDDASKFGDSWAIPDTAIKPTRTRNFKPGRKPKSKVNE